MNKTTSILFASFKWIYLIAFFTLVAGIFYSLITETPYDKVVSGVIISFVGLAGGVLLYKSATSRNKRMLFLVSGFALLTLSLFVIFAMTGRA